MKICLSLIKDNVNYDAQDLMQILKFQIAERGREERLNSPHTWPHSGNRDEKRSSHVQSSHDYENLESGPSHSKRRHRASPHRLVILV